MATSPRSWVLGLSMIAAACAASGLPQPAQRRGLNGSELAQRPAHEPGWIARHRSAAGADSGSCGRCHTERWCVDCHDGRVRPRTVHPGDWTVMHSVAARQRTGTCNSCHRRQSFCLPCHQRTGVSRSAPLAMLERQGRLHPPASVWSGSPRTPEHHGWQAQRRLADCVSCHTERDCAGCHASATVGARGGATQLGQDTNPHPRGFSSWCRRVWRANARPCLVCHDSADPLLEGCF